MNSFPPLKLIAAALLGILSAGCVSTGTLEKVFPVLNDGKYDSDSLTGTLHPSLNRSAIPLNSLTASRFIQVMFLTARAASAQLKSVKQAWRKMPLKKYLRQNRFRNGNNYL